LADIPASLGVDLRNLLLAVGRLAEVARFDDELDGLVEGVDGGCGVRDQSTRTA